MQRMTAQRGTATLLNRRHDLELPQAQMRVLSLSPGRPMGAEDIRDLQCGTHEGVSYTGGRISSGLVTSRSMSVAT